MKKHLLIVATLDTKGEKRLISRLRQKTRCTAVLMDVGILGEPLTPPDIHRNEVLEAAVITLIKSSERRIFHGIKAIQEAERSSQGVSWRQKAGWNLRDWRCTGTAIATMWCDPSFRLPKVMLSTVASRDMREYVGQKILSCSTPWQISWGPMIHAPHPRQVSSAICEWSRKTEKWIKKNPCRGDCLRH